MIYSEYKLNKQGDNIQPWRTPFPIWNQSVVPCPVLTVASWSAYRFSQEAGQVVWYSYLSQNFPQFTVIHTVKGFGIVNEAEVDVFFLELSCFFWCSTWVPPPQEELSFFSMLWLGDKARCQFCIASKGKGIWLTGFPETTGWGSQSVGENRRVY